MRLEPGFIEEMKKIVGSSNVLLDAEDLYVYSFQGPLGLRKGPRPNAVVRPRSEEEEIKVVKLARREGVSVIGVDEESSSDNLKHPMIILDASAHPDTSSITKALRKKPKRFKTSLDKTYASRYNTLSLYLSDSFISQCKECPQSSGVACRGFCSIAPFLNGAETWSSKGRLLLTRGLFLDELKPTKKLADSIFTCTACGQCYQQCTLGGDKMGLEFNRAIMFARREIAKKGFLPKAFEYAAGNILEHGNPMGMPVEERTLWLDGVSEKPRKKRADVLYWTGCTTAYRFPEVVASTARILTEAVDSFTTLGRDEGCCALVLLLTGLWDDAKKVALKNLAKIKDTGAKSLVTTCAGCYYAFKKLYPEFLGIKAPLNVLHLSQLVENAVEGGDLKFKELSMKVTYQDPCDLSRHCGVYEPPRNALKTIPGLQLVETPLNRDNGTCCGGGGGLWAFNTELSMKMAHSKLIREVSPLKVEAVVTACPACHMNLKYAARSKGVNIEVYEFSEIIEKALKKTA